MKRIYMTVFASLALFGTAVPAANACYRHTFDKCDGAEGGLAQMAATQALPPLRSANSDTKPAKAETAGWITTVKTNR